VPAPLPVAPEVTVIHAASGDAVHVQPVCDASTLTVPLPPAAANACVVGVTVNVQGAADWVTVKV
jgi:hypothetical protein